MLVWCNDNIIVSFTPTFTFKTSILNLVYMPTCIEVLNVKVGVKMAIILLL